MFQNDPQVATKQSYYRAKAIEYAHQNPMI